MKDIRDTATGDQNTGWIGKVYYTENGPNQEYYIGNYIDAFLLLIFGGIPWQVLCDIPYFLQYFKSILYNIKSDIVRRFSKVYCIISNQILCVGFPSERKQRMRNFWKWKGYTIVKKVRFQSVVGQ